MSEIQSDIAAMVHESQVDFSRSILNLPDHATTRKQVALMMKSGTPLDFAKACAACIGEISVAEAEVAVAKYLREWNNAR